MGAAVAGYLTFAVVLLGGWELTARLALIDADLLPPLSEVCVILWRFLHDPRFIADLGLTGGEVAGRVPPARPPPRIPRVLFLRWSSFRENIISVLAFRFVSPPTTLSA